MSEIQVLAWLGPFIILIIMVGAVAIVAINRAETKDIPTIIKEVMAAFRRIAGTLPQPDGERKDRTDVAADGGHEEQAEASKDDDAGAGR